MRVFTPAALLLASLIGIATAAFDKWPYVQHCVGSSAVIRWQLAAADSGRVRYGLTPGHGSVSVDTLVAIDHELSLDALLQDTVYYYQAISGPDSAAAWFRTPPLHGSGFRFVAYGDNRTDSAAHQSVVNRIVGLDPPPSLLINVGDLTADGTTEDYRTFFNISRALLDRVPLFPALGNHDASNLANWFRFFALPGNERWFSVRWGSCAFHAIDTESPFAPGSAQYDRLLAQLLADSADPDVQHIVVWFHEPPYTTNQAHPSNLEIRTHLSPLFTRFGVATAFTGHVHAYEHSLANGVHYITSGGGGAPLHGNWNDPEPWTVYREADYQFVLVDVWSDTMLCRSVRLDGSEYDTLLITGPPVSVAEPAPGSGVRRSRLRAAAGIARGRASVVLELPEPGPVEVVLFDALGRRVATLARGPLAAGTHRFSGVAPPGWYVARLRAGTRTAAVRLTVVD